MSDDLINILEIIANSSAEDFLADEQLCASDAR